MNRRCNYKKNGHNNLQQQRNMFLPIMICSRSSIKDVQPSHCRRRPSANPASPKPKRNSIGCVKYHSVGGFFSANKCTATTADTATVAKSDLLLNGSKYSGDIGSQHRETRVDLDFKGLRQISVAELDPPLPVVRRPPESGSGGEARESLWKRRSRESALRSLEVKSIIHGGATSIPANTV